MKIMDYSHNPSRVFADTGMDDDIDVVIQKMIDAHLPNGAYVQMRDYDGNVFRLVVKNGDIKQIFPKWDM